MTETVDVLKLRDGDRIRVELDFVGLSVSHNRFRCLNASGDYVVVSAKDIVSVEPRPLKVGDRVTGYVGLAETIAINGRFAWVLTNGTPSTIALSELSPA